MVEKNKGDYILIHLEDDIKKSLSEMLNDNTYGVEFDVNLYHYNKPSYFINKKFDTSSYKIEEIKYIITLIEEIEGSYEDVPHLDLMSPVVFMSFMIPVSNNETSYDRLKGQPNFKGFMSALEEIRRKNQARVINLGETGWWLKYDSGFRVEDESANVETFDFKIKPLDNVEETLIIDSTQIKLDKSENFLSIRTNTTNYDFEYEKDKAYDFKLSKDGNNIVVTVTDDNGDTQEKTIPNTDLPNSIKFNTFNGYYYYIGVSEETEGYNSIHIEDFDTLENEIDSEWDIIKDNEDKRGAVAFGDKGDITITFSTPRPASQTYQFGIDGVYHQTFDYNLTMSYSKDVFLGNHYRYFIDGVEIFPISRNQGYTGEPDSDQKIEGRTTKTLITDNSIANTYSTYHKNIGKLNEMFRKYQSLDTLEMNEGWTLRAEYPTHVDEYDVVIKDLGNQSNYNVPSTFTMVLNVKDDEI